MTIQTPLTRDRLLLAMPKDQGPKSNASFRIGSWILLAFLIFAVLRLVGGFQLGPHPLEGEPAPAVTLPRLDGGQFTLAQEPARVIVLDFWATWCRPCLWALPQLEQVQKWARSAEKSVAIYCVNLDAGPAAIDQLWQHSDLTMPVLLDLTGEAAAAYQVEGIPHTVVIAEGVIRHVHVGGTGDGAARLRREIEAILEE